MLIYSVFASSIAIAWWYAKREQKKFERYNIIYEHEYRNALKLIAELEEMGCVKKSDLIIEKQLG